MYALLLFLVSLSLACGLGPCQELLQLKCRDDEKCEVTTGGPLCAPKNLTQVCIENEEINMCDDRCEPSCAYAQEDSPMFRCPSTCDGSVCICKPDLFQMDGKSIDQKECKEFPLHCPFVTETVPFWMIQI